jgi:Protein of unknown function (DUF1552)
MIYDNIKRRHFLQGLGVSLALPMLPSLMPKAHAALGQNKSMVYISEHHGGVNEEFIYPSRNPANEQVLYTGDAAQGLDHRTRMEALMNFLQTRNSGLFPTTEMELSPVLGSFLNPHLSKINLVRGLDVMFYIGHHEGGYLGNFYETNEAVKPLLRPMETIDQIIARSSSFYATRPVLPIMQVASQWSFSYALQSGNIASANVQDNWTLVNSILGSAQPVSNNSQMTTYLNRIHDDYSRLSSGAFGASRRLSRDDKLRVEEHVSMLNELTTKIGNQGSASCSSALSPVANERADYWPAGLTQAQKIARWENTTNLIAGAIKCGASRLANIQVPVSANFQGDWHQQVAHRRDGENDPNVLRLLVENSRFTAQHVFTKLASKLDVDRGDGSTYLDNALISWVPEAGPVTHNFLDNYALTAGSAGGYFRTGNYVDYRNLTSRALVENNGTRLDKLRPGLPYVRWLYTLLKAMGVPDNEFARTGMIGYGDNYVDRNPSWYANKNGQQAWPTRLIPDMGKPMPRIVV